MKCRFHLLLIAFLLAASPLAAQTTEPPPPVEVDSEAEATTPEVGDRVDRAEQGMLRGIVILVDGENLIIETAEGDRAFSLRPDSELPAELSTADEWVAAKGLPVSVTFQPGEEGELRVVERVTVLPPSTVTTTLAAATPVEPAPETDLADPSDLVEPTEVSVPVGERLTTAPTGGRTTAAELAAANPDELETEPAIAATALTDDDAPPPPAETLAGLPATGSALPLLALIGSLALLAALALGRLEARRRRVQVTAADRH